jgi:polysaccharide biosynthesis/export protein
VFIRDAKRAGLNDSQIADNAVEAGWPSALVKNALQSITKPPESTEQRQEATGITTEPTGPIRDSSLGGVAVTREVKGVPDDYIIGEGDVLSIAVWREPDASVPVAVVRPDGKISMAMLKEVQVSGLTPAQAEKLITEQLRKFISSPDVTVIVSAIHSKRIYVIGGVKKEGPIPYTYRMTVLQTLSEAGGLTDYAKRKKIYVLRNENGRERQLPFDYDGVLKGKGMAMNIYLLPGDTVVVPK